MVFELWPKVGGAVTVRRETPGETATGDRLAIRTVGLAKSFAGLRVLEDVNLEVSAGTVHSLIGPNGAGKTTLLGILSGAIAPTRGRVELDGQDVTGLPPYERRRRGLARSFQVTNLFADLTVEDNITISWTAHYPWRSAVVRGSSRHGEVRVQVQDLLEKLSLGHLANVQAGTLSHGEQRLLELGLTLTGDPKVLLLDEPTAGMGRADAHHVMAVLREVIEGRTIVLVEHDVDLVMRISDRISVLHRGVLIADGPPEEVQKNEDVKAAYLVGIVE